MLTSTVGLVNDMDQVVVFAKQGRGNRTTSVENGCFDSACRCSVLPQPLHSDPMVPVALILAAPACATCKDSFKLLTPGNCTIIASASHAV